MFFKKRLNKKVEKFQANLIKYNVSENEQTKLVKIFKTITRLTNVLLSEIVLFVIALGTVLIVYLIKNNDSIKDIFNNHITNFEKTVLWVIGSIFGVLLIVNRILTIWFFFKVIFSRSKYIGFGIKFLNFLSIIPLVSFITAFIVKYKIKHIYKKNKNNKIEASV